MTSKQISITFSTSDFSKIKTN